MTCAGVLCGGLPQNLLPYSAYPSTLTTHHRGIQTHTPLQLMGCTPCIPNGRMPDSQILVRVSCFVFCIVVTGLDQQNWYLWSPFSCLVSDTQQALCALAELNRIALMARGTSAYQMLLRADAWQHKYTIWSSFLRTRLLGSSVIPLPTGGRVRSDDNNVILQQQASHIHDVPEAQICIWLIKVMSFHSIQNEAPRILVTNQTISMNIIRIYEYNTGVFTVLVTAPLSSAWREVTVASLPL